MRTYDFRRDTGRLALSTAFVDRGKMLPDILVGDTPRISCELCGGYPTTHLARMVVVDAEQGDEVVSTFRVCCDCWADARREGTLIAAVIVDAT